MTDRAMRAVVVNAFGPADVVTIGTVPEPVPGEGEVLIEVRAAPVNYVDLVVISGKYQFTPPLPFVPGKGPAGIIAACGPGVTGLSIGQRVLAMAEQGGYAERAVARSDQCYPLPASMSFSEAASMSLAYDTAWFALRERARIEPGETVLVLGASGAVGLAAVQLAKAMRARVLAGIGRPQHAATVRAAGADAVVDLSADDLRESLREQVIAATGGSLADIVLDPLGGDVFDAALRAVAWCGRLVVIGFAAGRIPSVKANYLMVKNIEVSGLQISDYRKRRPARVAECYRELFAFHDAGLIRPPATIELPLDRAAEALGLVHDRATNGRRVILLPHPVADGSRAATSRQ
jgi:NADPH2:quinone reductase